MFVVFDLDGTLALNQHRLHHIQKEPRDYAAYEAECPKDQICVPVLRALNAHMGAGHRVEIWTGRSARAFMETVRWLDAHGIDPRILTHMRLADDSRTNCVVKREWLHEARANEGAPDLVYEDMCDTTAMWRAEGVACFQVVGQEKSLGEYTDAEIATEHNHRMMRILGDPRVGVTIGASEPWK